MFNFELYIFVKRIRRKPSSARREWVVLNYVHTDQIRPMPISIYIYKVVISVCLSVCLDVR